MVYLFSVTLFLSAALLFWVQPMFGKMILPLLGSTPSVWNTCMVFFQAGLLLGYVYAHASITYLGVRKQAILHGLLLLLPLFFLPITIPHGWIPPTDKNPIPWMLMLMSVSIGIPFFVVSASAPMLQKWFSSTKHESAKDPYFLYVASNLGSMLVLIGYPVLIEPNLRLLEQCKFWQYSYFAYIALTIACAYVLLKSSTDLKETEAIKEDNKDKLTRDQRIRWILLSLVPSSLMLGVTTYISTDVSPVPLIWIIPLTLYLLTFIIVFSKNPPLEHELMVRIMPFVVLGSFVYIVAKGHPIGFVFFLHLLSFFVCAIVCHGELARTRPSTKHLTEFYLWISVGGCLGGIFNALIAPVIFKEVIEYPLAIVLACFLKPAVPDEGKKKENETIMDDVRWALIVAVLVVVIKYLITDIRKSDPKFLADPWWVTNAVIYGVPSVLVVLKLASRQIRFGLGVAAIILVYTYYSTLGQNLILVERNFFGIHRISMDSSKKVISLYHNTTLHGSQVVEEKDQCIPTTYYHKEGPIGQMFEAFKDDEQKMKVGALGVGTGSISCYGREDQDWVFYEIDQDIVKMNNKGKYFTYFANSPPETYVVYGDGRLKMKDSPRHYYDFIILDAFSSDAIPVHLVTREAMKMYLSKLKRDGIIAFHTSNRYLKLGPVIGNLVEDAHLTGLYQHDRGDSCTGRMGSEWILVARKKEDFRKLTADRRWQLLQGDPSLNVWTDDYSNIFSIFDWGKF